MKKKKKQLHQIKYIVEKHPDTYIAYPLGIKGACVSQGDTYDEALAEVKVMLKGMIETFGSDIIDDVDDPVMAVFVAEGEVAA